MSAMGVADRRARMSPAMKALVAGVSIPTAAIGEEDGASFLAMQRWLHAADVAAKST